MKVLVTGGGGFLGEYIIDRLLREGNEVRSFSRRDYPELAKIGVETLQGDLRDLHTLEKACKGIGVIFHTAAKVGTFGSYDDYYRTNVTGTKHLIQACQKEGIAKLIFTSSSSVTYTGKNKINADEKDPYPTYYYSPYSHTKALAEQLVLNANGPNLQTVALRPHLIFGPRDRYIIPSVIQKGKSGTLRIIGNGKNLTDVSYVENVAEAHIQAWKSLSPTSAVAGQAYYITQGEPLYLWEFINRILREFEIPEIKGHIPVPVAYGAAAFLEGLYKLLHIKQEPLLTRLVVLQLSTSHTYSILKAQRDFGYRPRISTEAGIQKTLHYFKAFSKK